MWVNLMDVTSTRHLFSGIRVIRFRSRLADSGGIVLRRFRLRDTRRLQHLFSTGTSFDSLEDSGGPPASLLGFWRWLHRTFQWFYTITGRDDGTERILGFIGLYDLQARCRVRLAMAVFRPRDRRRGVGRRALALLFADFCSRTVVQATYVDILRHNEASLAFFRRMGFQPKDAGENIQTLFLPMYSPTDPRISAPTRRPPPCPSAISVDRDGGG